MKGFPVCQSCGKPVFTGFGTALKPALEPVCVARKPLEGTVAANVVKWGTGCLNVGGCRIATTDNSNGGAYAEDSVKDVSTGSSFVTGVTGGEFKQPEGRWPANVVLDEEAGAMLDAQSGMLKSGAWNGHRNTAKTKNTYGAFEGRDEAGKIGDSGGASRFFYCAKASRAERERGCEGLPPRSGAEVVEREEGSQGLQSPRAGAGRTRVKVKNFHPT